jgi:hypothetical protein
MGVVCRNVLGVVIAAAIALPSVAQADTTDPAAAREQLKLGYNLSQAGKCDEAVPHLVESLRLDPKAITLINLANCEEKIGHLAEALGHWVEARSRAEAEAARAIGEEAKKRAKELEPRMPKLTIALAADAPKETSVVRDGVALGDVSLGMALPVNPGGHVVVAKASGHEPAQFEVDLAEGEAKTIEVAPGAPRAEPSSAMVPAAPAPSPPATSPLVWIGFGTAATGVAVGTITGVIALEKASAAKRDCPNLACTDPASVDDVSRGRTFGNISTVGFIVGGLGALVGVYGLVWARPKSDGAVSFDIGPRGGSVSGRF